ncbi:MAG TPA: serine/threonine-protein kinase [Labilithrix sp.]
MNTPAAAADASPDGATRLGEVVAGRYRIQKLLGEGGMGAVYLAEHTAMRKRVALKLLHKSVSDNAEVIARFEREAIAAAKIEHPNVAAATDFGRTGDGSLFLVLEYIEGQSLREVLAAGAMAWPRAIHVTKQIAAALGRAHEEGIVHRDLKPENVMLLNKDDDPDFVKVLDFGIAKLTGAAMPEGVDRSQPLTRMGTVLGTPEYMAPEQALGEAIGPGADLYALGVILYEMLAGRHMFDPPDRMAMLSFHLVAPVPAIADRAPNVIVPPPIEAIARKLLEKDSKARYTDARELIAAIDAATQASPPPSAVAPISSPGSERDAWKHEDNYAQTSLGIPSATRTTASGERPFGLGTVLDLVRTLPKPAQIGMLAAVPVGILFVVLAFVLASKPSGVQTGAEGGGGGILGVVLGTSEPAKPAQASEETIKAAEAKGLDALEALAKEYPHDPAVARALASGYFGQSRNADAMHAVKTFVDANPKEPVDPAMLRMVSDTAIAAGDGQDDAFALLEGPLGERGVDTLIEIAQRQHTYIRRNVPKPNDPALLASKSLEQPGVRAHASQAAAVLLDFKAAKGCTAKAALLDRVRDEGDARLIPILRAMRPHHGCGFAGLMECSTCPYLGEPLEEAIRGVEARTK